MPNNGFVLKVSGAALKEKGDVAAVAAVVAEVIAEGGRIRKELATKASAPRARSPRVGQKCQFFLEPAKEWIPCHVVAVDLELGFLEVESSDHKFKFSKVPMDSELLRFDHKSPRVGQTCQFFLEPAKAWIPCHVVAVDLELGFLEMESSDQKFKFSKVPIDSELLRFDHKSHLSTKRCCRTSVSKPRRKSPYVGQECKVYSHSCREWTRGCVKTITDDGSVVVTYQNAGLILEKTLSVDARELKLA